VSPAKRRTRSVQRGSDATTDAEREHQIDAIVERGARLKRRDAAEAALRGKTVLTPPATAPKRAAQRRQKRF
jgi:hypothetical protein